MRKRSGSDCKSNFCYLIETKIRLFTEEIMNSLSSGNIVKKIGNAPIILTTPSHLC